MAKGPALQAGDALFPINKLTNTVGRRDRITNSVPDIDLASLDVERAVSRKHAEMTYARGAILLRDVGSTNGTTVNGETLALQVDRYLQDGDTIAFGDLETSFVAVAAWPEGLEAEWPPEPEPAAEPEIASFAAEETMLMPPSAEETAVIPPVEVAVPAPEVAVFTPCSNHPHLPALGVCPGCLEAFCVDCLSERPGQPLTCARCAGIQARLGALVGRGESAAAAPSAGPDYAAPTPESPPPGSGMVETPPPAPSFPPPPPSQPPDFAAPPPGPQSVEPDQKQWPF